jgi:hypothetical protein
MGNAIECAPQIALSPVARFFIYIVSVVHAANTVSRASAMTLVIFTPTLLLLGLHAGPLCLTR